MSRCCDAMMQDLFTRSCRPDKSNQSRDDRGVADPILCRRLSAFALDPVLDAKGWNAAELSQIVGDDREPPRPGNGGDQQITLPDRTPGPLEPQPYFGVFLGRILLEGKHAERQQKRFDVCPSARGLAALGGAEQQLGKRDRADRDVVGAQALEPAQDFGPAFDGVDTGVRVEEVRHFSSTSASGVPGGSASGETKSSGTLPQLVQ